jgi:hypothetical protein
MSDQNVKGKSKYEAPILVPLGGIAKGSGVCSAGSAVVGGNWGGIGTCTVGTCFDALFPGITDCAPGANATQDCTAGPTAERDCTMGTCALRNCTAGVAATGPTCSAGDHAASCTAGAFQV